MSITVGPLRTIFAAPAGVSVLALAPLGTVGSAPQSSASLFVRLVDTPVSAPTPVTITSTQPGVVSVQGSVVIPAGAQGTLVPLTTGSAGEAVLTFRAGSGAQQLRVIVGQPALGQVALRPAAPVGMSVLA